MNTHSNRTEVDAEKALQAHNARPLSAAAQPAADRLQHLQTLATALRAELDAAIASSEVVSVHRVRTGTRRVEAMVDTLLRENRSRTASEAQAARLKSADRLLRRLKRIRRAAAPVRDLDVHRQLLERFAGVGREGRKVHEQHEQSEVEKLAYTPEKEAALKLQAEHLDAWLRHARQQRADDMVSQLTKILPKFDDVRTAFQQTWTAQPARRVAARPPHSAVRRTSAYVALEAFANLCTEMPLLDALNLHDFRKGAKKARYIAESDANDSHAKAVGKAIKRVQDVIGDWHDWLCLSGEAKTALGEEGADLIPMLDAEVARSYTAARRTTERMRGRLLGEWQAIHPARRSAPRHRAPSPPDRSNAS